MLMTLLFVLTLVEDDLGLCRPYFAVFWAGWALLGTQSYTSKGIWRQGNRLFCKEVLRFNTTPRRHMPLPVHLWGTVLAASFFAGLAPFRWTPGGKQLAKREWGHLFDSLSSYQLLRGRLGGLRWTPGLLLPPSFWRPRQSLGAPGSWAPWRSATSTWRRERQLLLRVMAIIIIITTIMIMIMIIIIIIIVIKMYDGYYG